MSSILVGGATSKAETGKPPRADRPYMVGTVYFLIRKWGVPVDKGIDISL